ncbi:M23 family metallopeptidase [Anaerosinus gibii]|uniref:M23 family metallopeptidase n=1 Tax=Selenobaculum gibii TaxID=3054208 RepID=A0A9Y2AFK5_9FIRM|nr:M23 family metallopeptidase [Selenobaculum gbiensis]WIW70735.1 M23 family metallopeptidase [Selenobaculum gbiensis]
MHKKVHKPDNREYTLKIIPHQGETVRSIRLPIRTIKYGAAAICLGVTLFVGALGYSTYNASLVEKDKAELTQLREVNGLQQAQLLQLSKKTAELQEDMEKLNELEVEIRQLTSIESNEVSRSGVTRLGAVHEGQGGPSITPNIENVNETLDDLIGSAKIRQQSLEDLKGKIKDKKAQMAITPSIWPASGDVSSRYGLRWNGSDFHPGIDIANDIGTPIVAAADGVVVDSGWNSGGYGYMVDLDHGNGIVTRYAHNSRNAVSVGQVVKKGQLIAYMGSTGFSTGPHVHYEVRVNGKAVNPDRFL